MLTSLPSTQQVTGLMASGQHTVKKYSLGWSTAHVTPSPRSPQSKWHNGDKREGCELPPDHIYFYFWIICTQYACLRPMGYNICFSSESSTHCQNRIRSRCPLHNTWVEIHLAIFLFMTNLQDRVFLYSRMCWQINNSKPLKENIIKYSMYSWICDFLCLLFFSKLLYLWLQETEQWPSKEKNVKIQNQFPQLLNIFYHHVLLFTPWRKACRKSEVKNL